jgi:cytoskeletal protein RodZ
MPTPPPRHLARPRRPWRLLLFVFGLTTAALAALVASATLLPQPEPPRRAPGVALPTVPTKPAPASASTTTTAPREPTTTPPPSTIPNPGRRAVSRPTTTTGPATAQAPATVGGTTTTTALSVLGATTTQPTMTAPSTTAGPTTTAPTTTAASTTTLGTTTSTAPTTGPTTTGPTTSAAPTTTGPATTTTGPVILDGSQPANVSPAAVGALLPILALLYLLRGLVPQAGGTHARRRRANHPRRRG